MQITDGRTDNQANRSRVHRARPDQCAWVILSVLLLCGSAGAAAAQVSIRIKDDNPYHVHTPGKPFHIQLSVTNASRGSVQYYWRDSHGKALSNPVPINAGAPQTIDSPARPIGYYGLVLETDSRGLSLPDRRAGEEREYGFAVLPTSSVAQRHLNPTSSFGMVQADPRDPYMGGWSKTTTWQSGRSHRNQNAVAPDEWRAHMGYVRNLGLVELPIILDAPWQSNDARPVPAAQLELIKSLTKQYFQADTEVVFWEVGIEENLSSNYRKAFYWSNLEAKTQAVRQAANETNPRIKLIYQVAGLDIDSVDRFLSSKAARVYDIVSLHPYAWPDFPTPETWLNEYVNTVRQHMTTNGIEDMPIWFTEIGAPHQGNYPGGFFGYPGDGHQVRGLSRLGDAVYMIKVHVLALQAGIEKIFWYNYRDNGNRREYAEDHFGLRDYQGFPKPVYAAYYNLRTRLENKSRGATRQVQGNVRVSEFNGATEDVLVAWIYTQNSSTNTCRTVAWSELREGLSKGGIKAVVNLVGTPVAAAADGLCVTDQPVFVVVKHGGS